MTESLRKYIYRLLILALILTCIGYALFNFFFPAYYFRLFPVLPVFLFAVTIVIHIYLVKASAGDPRKFAAKYLGSMGLKILIYLVFIVIMLLIDTANAIAFLVSFLAIYATLTAFEVISILYTLKNRNQFMK